MTDKKVTAVNTAENGATETVEKKQEISENGQAVAQGATDVLAVLNLFGRDLFRTQDKKTGEVKKESIHLVFLKYKGIDVGGVYSSPQLIDFWYTEKTKDLDTTGEIGLVVDYLFYKAKLMNQVPVKLSINGDFTNITKIFPMDKWETFLSMIADLN